MAVDGVCFYCVSDIWSVYFTKTPIVPMPEKQNLRLIAMHANEKLHNALLYTCTARARPCNWSLTYPPLHWHEQMMLLLKEHPAVSP